MVLKDASFYQFTLYNKEPPSTMNTDTNLNVTRLTICSSCSKSLHKVEFEFFDIIPPLKK